MTNWERKDYNYVKKNIERIKRLKELRGKGIIIVGMLPEGKHKLK